MARKLPWAGDPKPPAKRQRTIQTSIKSSPSPKPQKNAADPSNGARERTIPSTPSKRRAGSRSPSTSPPPAPPDVEPMLEGYDADDIYMMVEDEFQTLAQSFTRHLHHAEYKRLERKAKDAPRKVLPEPISPMSKKTKQRLERGVLANKQQKALDRIIAGKSTAHMDDPDEEKVEDPWRGTHLAGLMATGSQEKRSLKGLDRMPSSTRAAKGFSRTELDGEEDDQASVTRHRLGGSLLHQKDPLGAKDGSESHQNDRQVKPLSIPANVSSPEDHTPARRRRPSTTPEVPVKQPQSNGIHRNLPRDPPPKPEPRRKPSLLLKKRNLVKEVSKEDRLAEVPMFLG